MLNVFEYTNYRKFLLDFYHEQKSKNESFSYQIMANKAGFRSKSFIKLVIDGKKNLTRESALKINSVIKLNEKAFSYFEDLIAFNQAKTLKLRNLFFEKLSGYNPRNPARLVLQYEYEFYSKWYHNTIREIVTAIQFKEDYSWLARQLNPPISPKQAKESVQLLLKLNLIQKDENGYQLTDKILTTGDEVKSLAVSNFHFQNLNLAAKSIESTSSGERDISCLVAGLSLENFHVVKEEIQKFRKRILEIAQQEENVNRVYHINFQFFPSSEKLLGSQEKDEL